MQVSSNAFQSAALPSVSGRILLAEFQIIFSDLDPSRTSSFVVCGFDICLGKQWWVFHNCLGGHDPISTRLQQTLPHIVHIRNTPVAQYRDPISHPLHLHQSPNPNWHSPSSVEG